MVVQALRTRRAALVEFLLACGMAILLTFVFWGKLWMGGGLVRGDTYLYFFPQKQFLVQALGAGEFPLWNNRVGHGYPVLGESQTGALYPFHLLLYTTCDLNTAYSAVQITHYILAFVFTWMFARRLDLSPWGACFAALVYTYGWFPVRICLEWPIIGGAWLPLALWCVEDFLRTRRTRDPLLLCLALTMQILPGHYHLAFITLVTLAAYIPLRLWLAGGGLPDAVTSARMRYLGPLSLAMLCAFGLTAVQLIPSWELKHHSQRAVFGTENFFAYGHIPFWYLLQVAAPWWYFNNYLWQYYPPGTSTGTNLIEAHLYFGLLTLVLLGRGLWRRLYANDRRLLLFGAVGLLATVVATGCLLPVTKHLPGFNFFRGDGRFGIVTTLAVAVLAGGSLSDLCRRIRRPNRVVVTAVLVSVTTFELHVVGQRVTIAEILANPPLNSLDASPIRQILAAWPAPVRLFAPAANSTTLFSVASTPPFLGIGPAAYFNPATRLPPPVPFDQPATTEQIDWLRRAGVTHVISLVPLDGSLTWGRPRDARPVDWPVKLLWDKPDPFLGRVWPMLKPIYLYELLGGRGRVSWSKPSAGDRAEVRAYRANRVEVEATSAEGGSLILTDLDYPGWRVAIDNQSAESVTVDGMYRGVVVPSGQHTIVWTYSPRSVYIGAAISCLTLLVALPGLALLARKLAA